MPDKNQLHTTLSAYLHKLESLQEAIPALMAMTLVSRRMAYAKKTEFLRSNAELIDKTEEGESYKVKLEHQRLVERLDKKVRRASTAFSLLPSKFLVAFVSEYDAFLGALVKELFRSRPELLDGSERSLSFAELKAIGSVEAAYEHILEKEVESLLRKSHSEQFDWLENKFDISLRKGLNSWPIFIEITERRNLLVHCDGIVSTQYISVCKKHGVNLVEGVKIGSQLNTSREYLLEAYRCLYELGVKLTHVLWRKLLPDELGVADPSLINITYGLIHEADFNLARRLLDFSTCTLKKWASDSNRRMLVINRAQSYYHDGEHEKCNEILAKEDWTACGDSFRICVASLERNYEEAAGIMKRIGNDGSISEADYVDWPVFRDFRSSPDFLGAFREVFGREPVNVSSLVKEVDIHKVLAEDEDALRDEVLREAMPNKLLH